MKTNEELKKLITEEFGSIREEMRTCLGSIYGRVNDITDKVDAIADMVNVHERQIDHLQMKIEPGKTRVYKESGWVGYLCRFWDDDKKHCTYGILTHFCPDSEKLKYRRDNMGWYKNCEIVSAVEDIVFKPVLAADQDAIKRFLNEQRINNDFKIFDK